MITKIELTNFKSHAHTVIEPGRVTALVGPNGCGKTSLLQAVHCLTRLKEESVKQVFKDRFDFDILFKPTGAEPKIALKGRDPIIQSDWELSSNFGLHHSGDWIPSATWQLGGNSEFVEFVDAPLSKSILFPSLLSLPASFYFKASAEKLGGAAYSEKIPPVFESDGKGLAAVIAHLVLDAPEQVRAIEDSLRKIVPVIKKFGARFAKVKVKEKKLISVGGSQVAYDEERDVTGQELLFETINHKSLPAYAMSDGTLLVLGLLTLLYTPKSPNKIASDIILLDDIEAGLHPLAQRQLMQTLKDFAEKHDRQIILTSHSPYIVDELDAKDVWVMATDKEGISHTKRLSDHPDAKRALDVLTTGELWDAEGESWVIDNAPAELANA